MNCEELKKLKSEKNIEYQKSYYKKNKAKLIENACQKLECELCGRFITKNRLVAHQKTALCENTLSQKVLIQNRKAKYQSESVINPMQLSVKLPRTCEVCLSPTTLSEVSSGSLDIQLEDIYNKSPVIQNEDEQY